MKNTITLIFILTICSFSFAQVGIGTPTPNASAMLDIKSTEGGLLIPRMTETERDAITSPEKSLIIYQTDATEGFYYFDGNSWVALGGAGTADADWTIVGNDMYNANVGNVGIGTPTPTNLFHLKGVTSPEQLFEPSVPAQTVTLLDQNFNSSSSISEDGTNSGCGSGESTYGWEITSTDATVECTNCSGKWIYINSNYRSASGTSCEQDETAYVNLSLSPAQTTINISFDYRYVGYSGQSFKAYLYNNTTSSKVGADLVSLLTSGADTNFSGTVTSIVPGDSYSIKFEYYGKWDEGASVDNIFITEVTPAIPEIPYIAGSYVFRLEDGQQQPGYVLTSGVNGDATWKPVPTGITVVPQELLLAGSTLSISSGNSVDLSTLNLDVQTIDLLSFDSATNLLSLSLENDDEAPQTVDLSDLVGTDNQGADIFSLSGNTLSISLDRDNESPKTVNLSSISSGLFNFTNGLTESSGTVKLGGALTEDTTITTGSGSFDLTLQGDSRNIFQTNAAPYDFVKFGGTGNLPYGQMSTTEGNNYNMTDSGGRSYKVDIVAGFQSNNTYGNGTSGGSAVQVGSIEYLVDGLGELFSNSSLSPLEDNQYSAGTPAKRWSTIYATGGVSTTSDMNLKTNIKDLAYGLDEILKLKTITFQWKKNSIGKTKIPSNLKKRKIGFSAQQLLKVLPETVETHSWLPNGNGTYKRVKNNNLGVFYSDIIPITVKAIQEQQVQIDDLKARAIQLMKEIESLKK